MGKLVAIDGNSIINRAFYGIMGTKMLMTSDGKYTNAVYGFLAILFKILEDLNPDYLAVAFDLRAPTKRHELYKEYKGTRKGMPNELAEQMPILKDILRAMNITILEKEGYEADDILGTISKMAAAQGIDTIILSGDRDNFQLIEEKIKVRIPHTKGGKTETEDYDIKKVQEIYGLPPIKLIEVKGLMGDTSDNIPGIPGVGEKTALKLIKDYGSIETLYEKIEKMQDDLKGGLREKIVNNKELAFLSKQLGTIDTKTPIDITVEDLEKQEWDKEKVLEIFSELKFNRYIERFNLGEVKKQVEIEKIDIEQIEISSEKVKKIIQDVKQDKIIYYMLDKHNSENQELIIKKQINGISIYDEKENKVYYININDSLDILKEVFEDNEIQKCTYEIKEDIIMLKEIGIEPQNMSFDIKIAAYILNSATNQYDIKNLAETYLNTNLDDYISSEENEQVNQISLFEQPKKEVDKMQAVQTFVLRKLKQILEQQMKENNQIELFENIEMPLTPVLAEMEYEGIYVDKQELIEFGEKLQIKLHEITESIYELAGEQFNINSTKQLGEILFEKLKLTVHKKTKTGYSTDGDILEKLKEEHPIIEKILEYRQLAKLKSTFVDAMIPFINEKTGRIHSNFHQTVTATGRISSSEPNVQNIPTRIELGKMLRSVFKPQEANSYFIDADYSQIELRVFAHISEDEKMIKAFNNDEDIHSQVASNVFGVETNNITPELRTKAKAINFGIVYGISDYGLAEQMGIRKSEAKCYIEQYLRRYSGIRKFMEETPVKVKEKGYAETLFKRRRYIPELNSNNYLVRQFGTRAAMNTPIQGTAADIIKIAMINVYNELKNRKLKSKLILQVHDELLIETYEDEKELVKNILKNCMENVIKLSVPLKVDLNEGKSWYDAK